MDANLFDLSPLRAQFSALQQSTGDLHTGDLPTIFFDNPGGTQVPDSVIEAVADYYRHRNANVGCAFATSRRTDETVAQARQAVADLISAPGPECIVFGASMTALTFHFARSFGETLHPGDEIVVTSLDHDANVTPWTDLEAQGAVIKVVDFDTADGTLSPAAIQAALSERTRLIAVTMASNAIGTLPDVSAIAILAQSCGALLFVDAVQAVPHIPVDVQELECDFLVCSAYKFFGPHVGVLYGKPEHLERFTPHKVRPSKNTIPHRWETGTLNHEGLAGVTAAINYLAEVGERYGSEQWEERYQEWGYTGRALNLKLAMHTIQKYERLLSAHFLTGMSTLEEVTLYGLTDLERLEERVPTFAFTWPRLTPRATAEYLADCGINCFSGNYYALRLMERLGLEAQGGAVRIGMAHYNTISEIDRLIEALRHAPYAEG